MYKYPYWDDYWEEEGRNPPVILAEKKSGTNIDKQDKSMIGRSVKKYMEDEPSIGGYAENPRKSKVTRVQKLYQGFGELTQIEKENFVNMIRNFVVHGRL